MVGFFSFGESTISNVFVPLIPTSSSYLHLEDGGSLCQPRSSSTAGALTRSKLPRPEIVDVTVIGSPTCTLFGFASVVIVKFHIAPQNLAGGFCGTAFAPHATASVLVPPWPRPPNAFHASQKSGPENWPS